MKTILIIFLASIMINAQNIKEKFRLPSIFSDNMVLQQKAQAPIWGKAAPGSKIKITSTWKSKADAVADSSGLWVAKIKTPKFGGPFKLTISDGDSTIIFKNVMIGEVWVCSGQSNMEMPLAGWPPKDTIFTSAVEIPKANYPYLRLFTVTRAYSTQPQFDCVGEWSECTPQTASTFSATAFFFGKKLLNELNVPIGLIHTSWGGTPVEAWISGKYLSETENYKDFVSKLKESETEIKILNNWLNNLKIINVNGLDESIKWKDLNFDDDGCSLANYNDSAWHSMKLPTQWENTELGNFDGTVWFRKRIELPDTWMNKKLIIEFGAIDDMDITFINGVKVGSYETNGLWQVDRVYSIPQEINKEKILTIAVRVIDNQGGGGIWGIPGKMKIYPEDSSDTISIAGDWKYLPVAEYSAGKFFVFGSANLEFYNRPKLDISLSSNTPTTLYNGMIAPIIPFSIKGAIWYQGESNTGRPSEYKMLFPLMIKNWRVDWDAGNFPFYFVQIAPYNYGEGTKSELIREAQFQTLNVPNTGMAVTMDIGAADNIHPGNKKDVGERLARWTLAKDYKIKIPYSGPLYKSMKVDEGKIILSFEHGEGININFREGKNNFQIAGDNKIFYDAIVEIKGAKLIVYSSQVVNPVAVRYCWGNALEGTLYNKAGLPSPSFRTDNW